jgi:trehalose synthase-fused probable maltokinase
MTDDRTRLGVDGAVDDDALVPYLQEQRWYGAHSRELQSAYVVETVPLDDDGALRLALVDLVFDTGTHDLYQLLVRDEGGDVFDATGDPALATRLVELTAARAVVEGSGGHVTFDAIRPVTPPVSPMARPLGADASNTVVVVDDLLVKTYRHVRAGVNAELDMLLFFAEHEFAHAPELAGWYAYEGERVQATLGLLQRFVPDAIDGWVLGQRELASTPDAFFPRLEQLGAVVGQMHAVLASDGTDTSFAPEDPTPESAGLVSARIDEEIDATFDELGDREELAPLIGRRSQTHELVLASVPSGTQGRMIRTHGDLHLGQALWHPTVDSAGDWMVIDFEGEPARGSAARRHKASPLRDVAGMLRSLSYLASAVRRDGTEISDEWEREARSHFLAGYRASPVAAVLPSSLEAQEQQLTMFELEKAFYELRYELDHRPDWVDIPVGSIVGLLDGATV